MHAHTHTHNFVMHRMFLVGYTNELITGVRGSMYFCIVCPFYIASKFYMPVLLC